jgi:hypothetical protein
VTSTTSPDIQTHLARQHAEHALVEVHDRVVAALVSVHDGICVESHDQVVAELLRLLQEVQVSNVEQIESSSTVNDLVALRRRFSVTELDDLLRCWQELARSGPWRALGSVVHANVGETFGEIVRNFEFLHEILQGLGELG